MSLSWFRFSTGSLPLPLPSWPLLFHPLVVSTTGQPSRQAKNGDVWLGFLLDTGTGLHGCGARPHSP